MAQETQTTEAPAPATDALATDPSLCQQRPFPAAQAEYRVIFEHDAYESILAHAKTNQKEELCGILVGQLCKDPAGPYLHVTDAIRGREARGQTHQVTFTHSTWEHIHKEMEQDKYKDKRIVGWYHTHPGFGVYLSDVDLFAHQNFFDAPWQVALVVDFHQNKAGLFHWQAGKIVRARRYWIDDKPVWEPADPPSVSAPPKVAARSGPSRTTDDDPDRPAPGTFTSMLYPLAIIILVLGIVIAYPLLVLQWRSDYLETELLTTRKILAERSADQSAAIARLLADRIRKELDAGKSPQSLLPLMQQLLALDQDKSHQAAYLLLLPEFLPLAKPTTQPATTQSTTPK